MSKLIKPILTLLLCSLAGMAAAEEVNMNPGLWEWTAKMKVPGSNKQIPPTTNKRCLTKEDLVPAAKRPGQKCDIKDLQSSKEKVTWAMTCTSPNGPIASVGEMYYNGNTAQGNVKINTQGMLITSQMSGKRLGDCN